MQLPIEDLTAESFAPFGQIINTPQRPTDARGDGWQYWGGLTTLPPADAGYFIGYLNLGLRPPTALRFDWAERHAFSPELLAPLGGECVIHVAPADYPDELDRLPDLARFRLFRVRPGQAVLLDRQVWHGAPMALGRPSQVLVVLQQGTSPANTAVVQFPSGQALSVA